MIKHHVQILYTRSRILPSVKARCHLTSSIGSVTFSETKPISHGLIGANKREVPTAAPQHHQEGPEG